MTSDAGLSGTRGFDDTERIPEARLVQLFQLFDISEDQVTPFRARSVR